MELPVLILAAGASSRMRGADKLMQKVDGRPLVRRQAEMALNSGVGPVTVALPPMPHPRHDALEGLNVRPVAVADAGEGMNASLRTGLAALPPCEAAMVLLGDLPDLQVSDLQIIAQSVDLYSDFLIWRGMTAAGAPGHPVVFRATLFPLLRSLEGDSGGREAVAAAGDRVCLVPLSGSRAHADLDTPEDWADWRRHNPDRAT